MNLFTRFLSRSLKHHRLKRFIRYWDQLELLVITVYKSNQVTPEDEAVYYRVRHWLRQNYPQWEEILAPHWREALINQQKATEDPYLLLLSAETASQFIKIRKAMQNLAVAREGLNRFVQKLR